MKSLKREIEPSLENVMHEPEFPYFYVEGKQMPEIDSWEVGKEYTLTVKVRMKSYSTNINIKKQESHAEFDIESYEVKK